MHARKPRRSNWRVGYVMVAVAMWVAPAFALTPTGRLPVEAFATLPFLDGVSISASGRYASARVNRSGRYALVIYDLDEIGKKPPAVITAGNWDVNWARWVNDHRLIVSVRFPGRREGIATVETRVFALNADGSNVKVLVQPRQDEEVVQIQDQVVAILPGDPQHIYMALNPDDPARPRLYRVDVDDGHMSVIEPGKAGVQDWLLSADGQPLVAWGSDSELKSFSVYQRPNSTTEWSIVRKGDGFDGRFEPVLIDPKDHDVIYVESDHEDGLLGLYKYRCSTQKFIERVFRHDKVDLSEVLFDSTHEHVTGVTYVVDSGHTEWFDPHSRSVAEELGKLLPGWMLSEESASRDGARVVVWAGAPDHSARYHLYEPATRKLTYFAYTYPDLDKYDLAMPKSVHYKARDGLDITAYLSLPAGLSGQPAKPLPAVVMPHGGPAARDFAEFDPMVQMLVNRGYLVMQMNFRGSAGFGAEFMKAGHHQWGQAMQNDVTDATHWLIDNKFADPKHLCIVGASYGGYAALMGIVREPDLYTCSVSLAGVSDLPDMLLSEHNYLFAGQYWQRVIGQSWSDRKMLAENSPDRRAKDIRTPVLLVHGTRDRTVSPRQTEQMASALKDAGKTYRYVKLEDDDHYLSHGDTRLQFFRELDEFLAKYLQ